MAKPSTRMPDATPDLGLQVYAATLKSELERTGWTSTAYDRDGASRTYSLATQLLDHVRILNGSGRQS
jgi:hypothetical protein